MRYERDALLEHLYKEYYDAIYRQCLSLVGYRPCYYSLVEDCIQDTFLQAVEDYDELKHCKNPIGWMIRVAQNKVKSKYRDELRHGKVLSPPCQIKSADIASPTDSVDAFFARQETIEMIARIYHMLSEQEKKVFMAYFLNDTEQKEISSATGLSRNSVRAAIARIRKRARSIRCKDFLLFAACILLDKQSSVYHLHWIS